MDINSILSHSNSTIMNLKKSLKNLKKGTWFIKQSDNQPTYYQFLSNNDNDVELLRKGNKTKISILTFLESFVKAMRNQVREHEEYLLSKTEKMAVLKESFKSEYLTNLPEVLDVESHLFKMLTKVGRADIIYDIRTQGLDFIPMSEPVKPIQDLSGSMSNQKETKFDEKNCEFYMVTCRGNYGAKYRHTNYDDAVAEAQKIATKENHPCWVVGVITKVNP